MTKWTLTVRENNYVEIDGSSLSRQRFAGCSEREIRETSLSADGLQIPLQDLMDISIEASEEDQVSIAGALSNIHALGADHDQGLFKINADAGNYIASGMTGGVVEVHGNAGDFLGGARGANRVGMRGGVLRVIGNTGNYAGHRMRRGTILVQNNAGDFTGASMVAGTIAIGGTIGRDIGIAMKRGTIVLHNGAELIQQADKTPVRFSEPARYEPHFLSLFNEPLLSKIIQPYESQPVFRTRADRSVAGQGEIIFALDVPMA